MLLGFAALYAATGTFEFRELATLARSGTLPSKLAALGGIWPQVVFLGVLLGLAVKVPLFPFHTWLPPAYAEARCIPREVARDRLRAAGWRGFHDVDPHDRVVMVKARRPSGRMFELTIDRCSGEVVDARPIYGRWGRFADGPRRYWDRRPYY